MGSGAESNSLRGSWPIEKNVEKNDAHIIASGFALFAMFFGAGNLLYPIIIGSLTTATVPFALVGWSITAVVLPFLGLCAAILHKGDPELFFAPLGKVVGFVLVLMIVLLIGPFGGIPRCIAFSFYTIKEFHPNVNMPFFNGLFCILLFLLTQTYERLLQLLGYFLSPLLLGALLVLIVQGFLAEEELAASVYTPSEAFFFGFGSGYHTMDLFGSLFFAAPLLCGLRTDLLRSRSKVNEKELMPKALQIAGFSGSLLLAVNVSMALLAALNGEYLAEVEPDELFVKFVRITVDSYRGVIASAIALLCAITTSMPLVTIFALFLQRQLSNNSLPYRGCLAISLIITFAISTLNLEEIAHLIEPLIYLCYPALIVLTLGNIGRALWGWQGIQKPVYFTFALTFLIYLVL